MPAEETVVVLPDDVGLLPVASELVLAEERLELDLAKLEGFRPSLGFTEP